MSVFIKTETFNSKAKGLSRELRRQYINQHSSWVYEMNHSGISISSGYLVDQKQNPGGGGLLIIEADTYAEAISIIEKDPMILADLVTWELREWIQVSGKPVSTINEGDSP